MESTGFFIGTTSFFNCKHYYKTLTYIRIHTSCCSEYQRYQLLRAIHNNRKLFLSELLVVPNIKDINFWEQFTTTNRQTQTIRMLFRISKISTFESNSQQALADQFNVYGCSEYQRYQLLRAIHNTLTSGAYQSGVVPNIKDINFWEQFTTSIRPI